MVELRPPLPDYLQLEVTSACNLRCAMCLVRYRPPVNKLAGAMTEDLFRQVVDEVPTLRRLTLQGLGEPLLSPYLLGMIRYAKARRVTVGFNSNATLLSRAKAEELIDAGLDWLHVSLDGARAETYEGIRDGASFDTVVTNLTELIDAKRAAGRDKPWVRVVFVAMRRNVAELPELTRLLASIGVDQLWVQNLSHTFSDADPAGAYREIRDYAEDQALWTGEDRAAAEEAFAAARRAATAAGIQLRLPRLAAAPAPDVHDGPGCSWPWDGAYVTSQGVVQPCCMVMGDDRVALGRLGEQSFPEIWHGEAYTQFRKRLAGDDPPEVCRGCALYRRTF
jgi:radical SAM protein with 4Fe4S-binding SPASM domain